MSDRAGFDLYKPPCCFLPVGTYEISTDLGCCGASGRDPGNKTAALPHQQPAPSHLPPPDG